MKRYIDFRSEDWEERMDSRMQAARWNACLDGMGEDPPQAGVINGYPEELLVELLVEGWVAYEDVPPDRMLRQGVREAVMGTLSDDLDCLSQNEHTLVERMLIGDGSVALDSVGEMEAAYSLRMRLWADLGLENDTPTVRLDSQLMQALPPLLMRQLHHQRRGRIYVFDGMMHGVLYAAGYLDDRVPVEKFIQEVLQAERTASTERLARNFLEASYDTYPVTGYNLLVHEALADPEAILAMPAQQDMAMPELSAGQMIASMNGLLPEEMEPDETLQRALHGALRPEWETNEAASDLRFLAKQDAPMQTMQEIMASMLCVLPTPHMDGALQEMRRKIPRWVSQSAMPPAFPRKGAPGLLH